MSKKTFLLLFLIIIALAMVVWYFIGVKDTTTENTPNTLPHSQVPTKQTTPTHTSQNHTKTHKNTPTQVSIPKELSEKEIVYQEVLLFETLSIEEAQLTTAPRNNIEPISAIQITNHALASLKPKDTLTLTDIQGNDYPLTIRSVHTYDDGTTTTTGIYSDENINYTTTITQAAGTSYITLSTPTGIYEIETTNDVGYVYDAKEIRKRLHNNYKNDTILYHPKGD